MRIQDIHNKDDLIKYAKLGRNIRLENFTPTPPPHTPLDSYMKKLYDDIYTIVLYDTPIGIIIGERIFAPSYRKKYYISSTTTKWSNLLIKIGLEVTMDAFIEFVYEHLECSLKGKNEPFIEDFIRRLR